MDRERIISILRMADPENNFNGNERQNALNIAHKEMDKHGWSYASLGFTQAEAERIESQFSVSTFRDIGESHWWNPFSWGKSQGADTRQCDSKNKQDENYDSWVNTPKYNESGVSRNAPSRWVAGGPDGWDGDTPIFGGEGWS